MEAGHVLAGALGLAMVAVIVWDGFETIVLPRRVTRRLRLTGAFYRATWMPIAAAAARFRPGRKRDRYLSYYGPLSLILLIVVWAVGLVIGFALLQWAAHSPLQTPEHGDGFSLYFYMSGVTFFTLGFGDVFPLGSAGRAIAVAEAGTGFGFLAVVIGYLPVLYQSFSRREVAISMLDARAGTPPTGCELLRRYAEAGRLDKLSDLLEDWERWAADLLESHLSYPVLCYYRSQHDNQSWLSSLTCLLDACALVIVGVDGAHGWQARMTFAIARHAVVDLAQVFNSRPTGSGRERMADEDLAALRLLMKESGLALRAGPDADDQLRSLRRLYEPYVNALSCYLLIPTPPWIPERARADNWQTSAFERPAATRASAAAATDDGRGHF